MSNSAASAPTLQTDGRIERVLAWVFAYPLLSLQPVLLMLMAWGQIGRGFGLDDLFWTDNYFAQFVNGLGVGWLFGITWFVRYVLDHGRDRFHCRYSLLPSKDPAIHRLGQYLLLFWIPSLLLLSVPSFFMTGVTGWPLLAGQAVSVLFVVGIVYLNRRFGFRARLQKSWLFLIQPGIRSKRIPKEEYALHGFAFTFALLFMLALIAIYSAYAFDVVLPPILVLCVMLGLANGIYGYVAFHFQGYQLVLLVAVVLLAVVMNLSWVNPDQAYKLQFPNVADYYNDPVKINQEETADGEEVDHYFELLKAQEDDPSKAPKLLNGGKILEKRAKALQAKGEKPRVVLVATSGGGIRAAVWTALVLECLEMKIDGFRDHVHLITGASGGMVGAGVYVADFERGPVAQKHYDKDSGYSLYSTALAMDSLSPTVQTMLLRDVPSLWSPFAVSWDRGKALEEAWHRNLSEHLSEKLGESCRSPLQKSFTELQTAEDEARIPSLIYSPMLVEDGRRLFISNLDLLDLTWTWGDNLPFVPFNQVEKLKKYALKRMPDKPLRSLSAVEFFRLFPKATDFQIGTAARMNASFPLVSPGVSLPTIPPRRVVDAGYYDNTGVNLATAWLYQYRKQIREQTAGVVLIQIHAFRTAKMRRRLEATEQGKPGASSTFLQWLSTPGEGLLRARNSTAFQRNDERIAILQELFNEGDPPDKKHKFFTTVHFECQADANLSWILSERDKKNIVEEIYKDPQTQELQEHARERVDALKDWMKAPK